MQPEKNPNPFADRKKFIGKALTYSFLVIICSGAYTMPSTMPKLIKVLVVALAAGFFAAWMELRRPTCGMKQC